MGPKKGRRYSNAPVAKPRRPKPSANILTSTARSVSNPEIHFCSKEVAVYRKNGMKILYFEIKLAMRQKRKRDSSTTLEGSSSVVRLKAGNG